MPTHTSRLLRVDAAARHTITVAFDKPKGFTYRAGQTISLALPSRATGESPLRHIFSLSSAPHEPELAIVTRTRSESEFKQALAALPIGSRLTLSGPYGYFTPRLVSDRPLVLIAGGIGIAPLRSIVHEITHLESTRPCLLLCSNSQPEDAAFFLELQDLAQRNPNLGFRATITGARLEDWHGLTGRIDSGMLGRELIGLEHPECYIAGPSFMVEGIQNSLLALGLPKDDIYAERFYGY